MIQNLINNDLFAMLPDSIDNILQIFDGKSDSDIIASTHYSSESKERTYKIQGHTALIEIKGSIFKNGGSFFGFSWAGQDDIKRDVDLALADKSVKAILLVIDSPGGVATGTKELAEHISSIKTKKIYAFADGLCASAAYWIASACNKIYTTETSTIGSIGVLRVHRDSSKAYENIGIKYTYITGGSDKALGNSETALSVEDKEKMQASVNKFYDIFKTSVVKNRKKLDISASNNWAEGKIFLGSEALQLGLIDKLVKNKDEAIASINKEFIMDKKELISTYPEIIESIKNEAKTEALTQLEQEKAESQKAFVTLVEKLAGSEIAEKVNTLASMSLNTEQINALIPLVEKKESVLENSAESTSREDILNALTTATSEPLLTNTAHRLEQDPIKAMVNQISSIQ